MSKTEKRVALVANAYLLERDALRVELDAMRQRAEAVQKDADAMRCLAYERTQRKDIAEAALAAAEQRAEAAAWQDGGFCSQCGADRVRTSTDDIDAPMLHTLSYCVACGGFWIWDHEAQQSKVQP